MTASLLQREALSAKALEYIEQYLKLSDEHRITVGIYNNGKTYVLEQPYDDLNYRYDIGSISKTMTAHLILSLAEKGKVDIDDSVNVYLKLKEGNYPTLRELLTHTAGYGHLSPVEITLPALSRHSYSRKNVYEHCTSSTVINALERRRHILNRKKRYGYSDFAFAVLALVAEAVEGRAFHEIFEEFVQNDLGMGETLIRVEDRAPPSVCRKRIIPYWVWHKENPYIAAGGLVSTVSDMLKYISCQINSNEKYIVNAHRFSEAVGGSKNKTGICLGWHTYQRSDQLWHVGGVGTFRSSVIVNRKRRFGVIVLGNAKGKDRANVHYLAKMIYSEYKKKKINFSKHVPITEQ